MDLCTLPVTGSDGTLAATVVVVAAIAAIGAGLLLRLRSQARRRAAGIVAALALVGVVALGSSLSAPSAQADASSDCVESTQTAPTGGAAAPSPSAPTAPAPSTPAPTSPAPTSPAPTAPPTEEPALQVVPEAPTAAAQCGLEPSIVIPTQEGVAYVEQRDGAILTVTASATAGYVVADGAQTTWTFDTTPTASTPFPLDLPAETTAFASFTVLPDPNATYGLLDRALIPSLLAEVEPGVLDLSFSSSATTMPVTFALLEGAAFREVTVDVPVSFELAYDAERQLLVLTDTVPGSTEAAVAAARAEVQAANPGAQLFRSFSAGPDLGLSIDVAYVPGPGCETESYSVVIDAVVPD